VSPNEMDILLVEDDRRDVLLTVRELERHLEGVHIEVARDGEEALDFLFCRGAHAGRPNRLPRVVLLDLKLPKIDGLQVLREIKTSPRMQMIPVIALTSSREEKDRAESYRLGVNSYIQKPVDFEQFRETIRTVGLYWLRFNESPPGGVPGLGA
jgi:two-component system, response regulator